MRSRLRLLPTLVLAALAGCTTTWTARVARPPAALQWPFAPAPAKLVYERALTGFATSASVGRAVRSLVYGRETSADGGFGLPVAVAIGADDRIAVADTGRRCVHLFVPAEPRYQKLTGPRRSPLQSPVGVLFDEAQRLWVTDSSGRLLVFAPDGTLAFERRAVGGIALQRPTGIAYSPVSKRVFVVDTLAHGVRVLDSQGDLVAAFGERGAGDGSFNFPTHVAWAAPGEIFVTDTLNFRVQILDEQGRFVGAFGRHGDAWGEIAMPKGIAVDRAGVVYLADAIFDNLQLFDRHGRFLLTVGRRGTDFGELWLPAGIFISERGELFVCDSYNHRIQVFRIVQSHEPPPS